MILDWPGPWPPTLEPVPPKWRMNPDGTIEYIGPERPPPPREPEPVPVYQAESSLTLALSAVSVLRIICGCAAASSRTLSVVPRAQVRPGTFPSNPGNLLPNLPRDPSGRIYPSNFIRIRPEQHALRVGESYCARHHGLHYHVEVRPHPGMGWNNPQVVPIKPPGWVPGSGKGFLPGEPFPGATFPK